jgi:hypothetical protein
MKNILAALAIVLLCAAAAWAEEGGRLVALVGVGTEPYTKAQFYNPEGNTAPIKVTVTITEQGADFVWEILPQPATEPIPTVEPTITGE